MCSARIWSNGIWKRISNSGFAVAVVVGMNNCFVRTDLALLLSRETCKKLKLTPETVAWGYYSAGAKPAMRIHSGDAVKIETCLGNPDRLLAVSVPRIRLDAEPGDVLEVQIK